MRALLIGAAISMFGQIALGQTANTRHQAADSPSANQQQAAQPAQKADHAQHNAAPQAAERLRQETDPNYRWFNGRWWYWQNNGWLVWNGSRWVPQNQMQRQAYSYQPQRSNAYQSRRSYSYIGTPEGGYYVPFVPTENGLPRSDASGMANGFYTPYNGEYQKVLPSFGVRAADAKALGIY